MKTKNNLKNFSKIPSKIYLKFIKIVGGFNHTRYMKMYIPYLKKKGMDIHGNPVYIATDVSFDGKDYSKIHIGDGVVISSGCRIMTHDYSITRALLSIDEKLEKEVYYLKDVKIGNNCFVGARSILLPGVELGDNVIVGAGSVVRGKIESNQIIIGNPAESIANTQEWAKKKKEQGGYYENK